MTHILVLRRDYLDTISNRLKECAEFPEKFSKEVLYCAAKILNVLKRWQSWKVRQGLSAWVYMPIIRRGSKAPESSKATSFHNELLGEHGRDCISKALRLLKWINFIDRKGSDYGGQDHTLHYKLLIQLNDEENSEVVQTTLEADEPTLEIGSPSPETAETTNINTETNTETVSETDILSNPEGEALALEEDEQEKTVAGGKPPNQPKGLKLKSQLPEKPKAPEGFSEWFREAQLRKVAIASIEESGVRKVAIRCGRTQEIWLNWEDAKTKSWEELEALGKSEIPPQLSQRIEQLASGQVPPPSNEPDKFSNEVAKINQWLQEFRPDGSNGPLRLEAIRWVGRWMKEDNPPIEPVYQDNLLIGVQEVEF